MFPLLDTFIAVYEMGQFTIAADRLHVSQSTVSARIGVLERSVGSALFERHAKSDVTPTTAGRILYGTALAIGERWREGHSRIASAATNREPFLVSCSHTTSEVLIGGIVTELSDRLDAVEPTIAVSNSEDILDAVCVNNVQLGIVEKAISGKAVTRRAIASDRLVLAGSPDGVWLLREPGSGVRYYTSLFLSVSHVVPDRQIVLRSNSAIVSCLAAGIGQSVISSRLVPEGIPSRDLGPDFVRSFYAITPVSGLSSRQREVCDAIIDRLRAGKD